MITFKRAALLSGAAVAVLALAGAALAHGGSARAASSTTPADSLVLGTAGSPQPQTMEEFLTGVTKDVDTYWTQVFKDSGLPEPRVAYDWIPAGQTVAGACDGDG